MTDEQRKRLAEIRERVKSAKPKVIDADIPFLLDLVDKTNKDMEIKERHIAKLEATVNKLQRQCDAKNRFIKSQTESIAILADAARAEGV